MALPGPAFSLVDFSSEYLELAVLLSRFLAKLTQRLQDKRQKRGLGWGGWGKGDSNCLGLLSLELERGNISSFGACTECNSPDSRFKVKI